ncbi:MAG TPA: DUF6325 family protein [Candidatus Saccharimonadales bacterium]|nr:DUF6325 family protein [Candidatus Saccharimonadales bacterium]
MLGPIDYIVVGFEGNKFDGSIADELVKAAQDGIIRVVDLLFIVKDMNGNVTVGEYENQPAELQKAFSKLGITDDTPLFTEDDIDKVADQLDPNTAAGVLVLEHLWAKGLKKAIKDAGGMLVADGRIHPEAVEAAAKELATVK